MIDIESNTEKAGTVWLVPLKSGSGISASQSKASKPARKKEKNKKKPANTTTTTRTIILFFLPLLPLHASGCWSLIVSLLAPR